MSGGCEVSEKRNWGSTVLGWFVEREGEAEGGPPGPEAAVEGEPPAAGDEPSRAAPPVELKGEVPLPAEAGGAIEFSAIYRAAGLGQEEQGRIDKALTLLQTLPAETPKEVKRQIVEASLKAFGYPVEQIIEAGVAEIRALQALIEFSQRDTQKVIAETSVRIDALNREIAEIKASMERKASAHQALTTQCNRKKLQVQEVLEFFGQEVVARVVRESPKLHEPPADK
jgi:hypothetical protein